VKYVMAFGTREHGPLLLEEPISRETIAAECREAALAFMSGVAGGWEKIDLARWLTGPYARATRHCQHGERAHVDERAPRSANGSIIRPAAVEDLLTLTRGRILAALEKAALSDGSLEFADDAIDRGFVRRAIDEDRIEVWVPVDGPRMRLQDRVRSLFVADYLNAPVSYSALYVCHRCEQVVFDDNARQLGMCSAHRRMSGMVQKNAGEAPPSAVGDE